MKNTRLGVQLLCSTVVIFISSCATLPQPQVNDYYSPKESYSTIGLMVSDDRGKSTVGSVGLTSFNMDGLDTIFSSILRNDLNSNWNVNLDLNYAHDSQLHHFIDVSIQSCSFVSVDALLDDADGECSVKLVLRDSNKKSVYSETYIVNNNMRVSWPVMSKNTKIVKDLLQRVSVKIYDDNTLRQKLGV